MRHQARVVEHDVDPPVLLDRRVDEMFDLCRIGDIGRDGQRHSAIRDDCLGQRIGPVEPPRAQHDNRALRRARNSQIVFKHATLAGSFNPTRGKDSPN